VPFNDLLSILWQWGYFVPPARGVSNQLRSEYTGGRSATPQDRLADLGRAIEVLRAEARAYRRQRRNWVAAFQAADRDAQADECERCRRRLLVVLAGGEKRERKEA
jgi:hypothetical protein